MNKIDKIINWFESRIGKITYSMTNRNGPKSYDCSSSIYYAVCEALSIPIDWARSTATLPQFLLNNGFYKVTENREWQAKRGDIVIWSKQKGVAGASAHTGIFVSNSKIAHTNYSRNGISIDDEADLLSLYNWNYEVYRLKSEYQISDVNGWERQGSIWLYAKNGKYLKNEWLFWKNKWYYFDAKGYMVVDKFISINSETFYINSEGVCELNYVKNIKGKTYAFDSRGALLTDKIIDATGEIK